MQEELQKYLKGVKKANLAKLEEKVESFVIDSDEYSNKALKYVINIRSNPAFHSRARIAPEREGRKTETISLGFKNALMDCLFCDPLKRAAKFSKETGLEEQYFLNETAAFSNKFSFGKIHGVVVYNYKRHVADPRTLSIGDFADGMKLVQKIGKKSKKNYVSLHMNCGVKAASSLEHIHGQFHCEDEPLSRTYRLMMFSKKSYWKSWVKAMDDAGLVLDFDAKSKTVMFVEWSPVFGKTEIVIMNLMTPSFLNLSDEEIDASARFLFRAINITMNNVSDQFNIVNLSASSKDNFCNQFRVYPRSPLSHGTKTWEGYLEAMGETVPHIKPENLIEMIKKSDKLNSQM
jgi:diadenosine tetraphosphate (Ap4A) HIT family hydrolase